MSDQQAQEGRGEQERRPERPRAVAIKTAKSRAKAKATLHGQVRRHDRPVLVVGATGGLGAAVANELLSRGEKVRLLVRDQGSAVRMYGSSTPGEIYKGDALDAASLKRAAKGARAIVHAAHPPLDKWEPQLIEMGRSVLEACEATKTPLLMPGNVWVFGKTPGVLLDERTKPNPCTKKGRVRAELESMLREAADAGRVRVILLRSGDYFGPSVRNPYVDNIFGRAAQGKSIRLLGNPQAPHQWAYAPDVARVAVWLIDRVTHLRRWEVLHFKGHIADPHRDFLRRVAEIAGHPDLPIKRLPWWKVRLASLFSPVTREVLEQRYLFNEAVMLDDRLLLHNWADFTCTDIDRAIGETVSSYRSIERA